jgi:Immunoglobulin-like domain of bacterial spore germination
MVSFANIVIRQPQAQDIVDDPIQISGISNLFEGTVQVRVRDRNGVKIAQKFFTIPGGTFFGNFQITMPIRNP